MRLVITVLMAMLIGKCVAQTNQMMPKEVALKLDKIFRGIQFSILLDTNVIAVGSTNMLQCRIVNCSTNDVLYGNIATFNVYLTNCLGNSYSLVEPLKSPVSNMNDISQQGPFVVFFRLEAGKTNECSVPFVVSNNIPFGNYQLVANQIVAQATTNLGKYLTSGLDVKVVK